MIGSRSWRALIRRNVIYRKRNWIGTILELFLPVAFVGILVAIKNSAENSSSFAPQTIPAIYPSDFFAFSPLTFADYVTAMQAKRYCVAEESSNDDDDNDVSFNITGILSQGDNWQVPLVKCDSRKCTQNGQDARPFCEYGSIAVAASSVSDSGGKARAMDFRQWVHDTYPATQNLSSWLGLNYTYDFVQVFDSPEQMNDYVTSSEYGVMNNNNNNNSTTTSTINPKIVMGIVWNGNSTMQYKYSLRQNATNYNAPEAQARDGVRTTPPTNKLFASYAKTDFESCPNTDGGAYLGPLENSCTGQYLYNGVLTFQRLVGDYILEKSGAATPDGGGYFVSEGGVQYVQFPTQEFVLNGFYASIQVYAPLLVALGLLYPVAAMISYISREKELRQKELMKMMSVTESDIGWAWFVTFFSFCFLTASATAGVSVALYENSDPFLLWLFWIFTFLAVVVFSMFTPTLTSKTTQNVLIGLLVFLIGFFLTLAVDLQTGNSALIGLISLHPVAAFSYGLQEIGRLEDQGVGLTLNTAGSTDSPSGYTFQNTLFSLIVDSILWGIMTWYLNRVLRPEFGQALPLWFPFTSSYWCPGRARAPQEEGNSDSGDDEQEGIPFEPVGNVLLRQKAEGKSIEIHKLRKVFGEKTAVDGMSLSMYSGQITALLGHNGAGKTTTINCLTGALGPTEGYATIAGKDTRTQMNQIRQDIGFCPQHDCLFPQLTVREHLQFFARIKGLYAKLPKVEAEEHISQAIQDVALSEKRNSLSKNLSGGMKRKLSVAIAFCGGSTIVLLDEPTSGMDPFSRRFTWSVIRSNRQGRCIILTTHHMDEADILGDRIAIMSEGQLRCAGSSLFLKKTYGVGYQLTIEKLKNRGVQVDLTVAHDNHSQENGIVSKATNDDNLKGIVVCAVEEATLLSNVGSEMSFSLPVGAASKFAPMFEGLDNEIDKGTVSSYGVSITTLDEVFLLVARGETTKREEFASASARMSSPAAVENGPAADENGPAAVEDLPDKSARSRLDLETDGLFLTHLQALFKKRVANFKRDKKAWVCTTILPSLFVLVGFILFTFSSRMRDLEPVTLSLNDYNEQVTTAPRNPIPFNEPGKLPFQCQPGNCAYEQPVAFHPELNELYYFCGYKGRLLDSPNCSISESATISERIVDDGASAEATVVGDISQVSQSLAATASSHAATQYGAIFFSHDLASTLGDGTTSYNSTVMDTCKERPGNYTSSSSCDVFGGLGYVITYNFTALHVAPLYQTLADEALVRESLNTNEFSIECTIDPLPVTEIEAKLAGSENVLTAWFLVVLSFPFIAGAFATFVVLERQSKAKHLQTVAGVQPSAYWISTYLWDVMNYQIPLWVTVILMFAFNVDLLTTTSQEVVSGVIVTLFLFGPAAAGFTYCITFAFTSAAVCNVFVIIFGFLIGMGGPIAIFILQLIGNDPLNRQQHLIDAATILSWILRFIPAFNLGNGLFRAINIETLSLLEGKKLSAWSEQVLLYEVVFLAWEGIAYLVLAIWLDRWSTNPRLVSYWQQIARFITCRCLSRSGHSSDGSATITLPDDDDVIAEQDRVLSGEANDELIVLRQLTKKYDNQKLAVNNLSFGIPPGECFGLLGINGAGKTSTMAMLTAEFPPTSGDATLAGFSVCYEPQKTRRRIGYCPQFDAHFLNMTGREHVELYAAIKGVPKKFIKAAASAKLSEVGLRDADCDRLSSEYSGGMKRRLSLACAMIGQPQIVFLDECSTGVDPVARREIWQLISDMVAGGNFPEEERTSVILTTHSMEECEALCPRIAIMANGRLRCLGSAQHLKNKFGQGYQIEMKVKFVDGDDEDYVTNASSLLVLSSGGRLDENADAELAESTSSVAAAGEDTSFTLAQVQEALQGLTGDDYLSSMVTADNPTGFVLWKDATSAVGATLNDVAAFCTTELRMRNLEHFIKESYPSHYVLRERQDTKARYEVSSMDGGVRLASIFANIEANKEKLRLADYGVSQTSLEQVFNMHAAAEAERLKQEGRYDD